MIDLSILIPSVHTRYDTFGRTIQDQVWEQLASLPEDQQQRIEILMLTDNKSMMLGQKRNMLVDIAQGRYVQFVDDDDRIEPDMFARILHAIDIDPADVITFLVSVSLNGAEPKICEYSLHFKADCNTEYGYERLPNHICAVKRALARRVSFPNVVYGEDSAYSKLLKPLLSSEHHIHEVLYHYDWSSQTSETQEHRPGVLRTRDVKPLVDVVIVSDAQNRRLKTLTQATINSCLAGANSLPVHMVVIEQQSGIRYQHAQTVFAGDVFNYNRFVNRGIQLGFAPWIVVANNDLVFHDGWLHELLAVNYPLVSPKCPRDSRQAHLTENTCGCNNGEHFSGWCFMISRQLWHELGGFDDEVAFWCSDDVVIEQAEAHTVVPMLVVSSVVEHLRSQTLDHSPDYDWLTWGQVEIFNRKYHANKFIDDPRYQEWLRTRNDKIESAS